MKLQPIINPHAKVGQVLKKTKAQEHDEFIMQTKTQVLEKYGKKSGNRFAQHKKNMTGSKTNLGQGEDDKFLQDKVDCKSQCIKLMQEGYLNAFVDFFYIANDEGIETPSAIEPNQRLKDD